jgi:YfiH family protein
MTTRTGGCSVAPFDSLNLRHGLGDDEACVRRNQSRLQAAIGAHPVWLNQVHGCRVVGLQLADRSPGAPVHTADASFCTQPGLACVVQVADCLPVLLAARGSVVAAAHAGWRGLAGGVLEATVEAVCGAAGCPADAVEAWLGPCIGPRQFEVGADVLEAFGAGPHGAGSGRFRSRGATHPGKWLADLAGLAEDRLRTAGVTRVQAAGLCTVEDASRFFSFRRDGLTGRMAAAIWLDDR